MWFPEASHYGSYASGAKDNLCPSLIAAGKGWLIFVIFIGWYAESKTNQIIDVF